MTRVKIENWFTDCPVASQLDRGGRSAVSQMLMMLVSVSVCLVSLLLSVSGLSEVYRWPGGRGRPRVAWPNSSWAEQYGRLEVTVIGIKVWADNIYLTAPRWNGNVGCLSYLEECSTLIGPGPSRLCSDYEIMMLLCQLTYATKTK